MVIVIPNSFQLFTISIFTLLFVFIFFSTKKVYDVFLILNWLVLSFLFLGYILISPIENSNKVELVFKYIISPIFWITIFCYIRKNFTLEFIIKKLIIFGFVCNLSVLVLYIIMSLGYISLIKYLIIAPNVDSSSGLGFILHVYGSLVFFGITMMPSILFIKNIFYRIVYVFLFLVAAILSGRTALILFVVLGLSLFFFYINRFKFNAKTLVIMSAISLLLGQIAYVEYTKYFDTNLMGYLKDHHLNKIKESGGDERSIQTRQILDKFYKDPLGSGFVTLDIVRNEMKTFNYEVLILAVLMRFGIVTFLIIIFSIIINFYHLFLKRWYNRREERDFFVLGFLAILIVSFTNPYLESFCFQWMFFGPLVLMKEKIISLTPENQAIMQD